MRARLHPFGEPLGPWTLHHWLGAVVVVLIFLGLALNIWPGWPQIARFLG